MDDPDAKLAFVRQTLQALRSEIGGSATLLGFIGGLGPAGQLGHWHAGTCGCSHSGGLKSWQHVCGM